MERVQQEQSQGQPPPPDMMLIRNRAQIALAQAAYPDLAGNALMKQWNEDGLSTHFSDYFEDSAHSHELALFDAKNLAAAKELLNKIRSYKKSPENLH